MKKLFVGLLFALWFVAPAQAQTARVVPVCSTLPQSYAPGATRDITQDVNGNTCIAGTFSQTGGTVSNAASAQATSSTNQGSVSWLYGFNGTTWDQLQVDASKFLKINCVTGCAGGTFNNNADAVATSATNGQAAAWLYGFNGTTYDRLRADTTNGLWVNVKADATAAALLGAVNAPAPVIAGTLPSTQTPVATGATTKLQSDLNGNIYANPVSQYPAGAVPLTASATGTTAATTATLAGAVGKTTYLCSYSIRANATAATTVQNTITGVITATLTHQMWVAPAASGLGVDEQIFNPCVPASATNTGIAVVSGAPGAGGLVSATATGYQL